MCYVKCAYNNYLKHPTEKGFGVVVICIPISSMLEKLSLDATTANSSVIFLNEYNEILYTHGPEIPDFPLEYGFDKDEQHAVLTIRNSLRITILFSFATLGILVLVIYVVSARITAPIISFAQLIGTIRDTRTFDTSALNHFRDKEIRILCSSFSSLIHRENALIGQITEESQAKRNAMLHTLQAQINPHFLYNALDAVNWMALSRNEDQIADVIASITNMMHYSISSPDAKVSIRQELDNIQEFIRISQLEYPMEIHLEVLPEEETLLSEILNAYLQYQDVDLTVSNGFGIRNVNERLHLHYADTSGLSYQKTSDGKLMAVLTLPV